MKIQTSVRELYDQQKALNEALKPLVDSTIHSFKEARWHYESRVKELESFAVKLESGRFKDPKNLEDFLAGTIVVPTSTTIPRVEKVLCERFQLVHRKPVDGAKTFKAGNAFPFDDLRLYLKRGNDGSRPAEPRDEVVFEIQVKTFLQHAWGIATHDLSYKTDDVRWGKDRIVGHLRASIEYAEIGILEADTLSKSALLSVSNPETLRISSIIATLQKHWLRDELPNNLRGLAATLDPILFSLGMDHEALDELLENEKVNGGGALPLNLSPYSVIVQAIARTRSGDLDAKLKGKRFRIFLTPELNLPAGFPSAAASASVVRVGGSSAVGA